MGKYEEALERARQGMPIDEVFPELKESEDERVRKGLIEIFNSALGQDFLQRKAGLDRDKVITYLEKQKEQKPTELPKSEDYGIDGLYAAVDILQKTLGKVDGYQTDDGILEHKCAISAVKELYEQKPAEWSEEDEEMLDAMIDIVSNSLYEPLCPREGMLIWLKSLRPRPHWKPSEEQMTELRHAISGCSYDIEPLVEIEEHLKKLM